MATYRGIKGIHINSVAGDIGAVQLGDIWYNSTLGKIRVGKTTAGAWASGGAVPVAMNSQACGGTQTAAISASGNTPGGATVNVQSYDGSSWTEINNVNTGRNGIRGTGTTAAFVAWGGTPSDNIATEEFNGTSWTEVPGDINTPRYATAATGTATAALATGGNAHDPMSDANESYDGSTWTELADLNTARQAPASAGVTTAAICFGGGNPGYLDVSETWDNSSWTEGDNLNTARGYNMGTGTSVPGALAFGGRLPAGAAVTEQYDGSSWTEVADLSTARGDGGEAGTQTLALCVSGQPPATTAVEEWTGDHAAAATVTSS